MNTRFPWFKLSKKGGSLWVAALFLLLSAEVWAGAWTRAPFEFYFQSSISYYQTTDTYDRFGKKMPFVIPRNPDLVFTPSARSEYRQVNTNLYFELGLPRDFELVIDLPIYTRGTIASSVGDFSVSSLGDAIVGVKYKFYDLRSLVMSLQFDVGLPLGNSDATVDAGRRPFPMGDGERDYALRYLVSKSFYPLPLYVSTDIGYRFRTQANLIEFPDDIPYRVETGYTIDLSAKGLLRSLTLIMGFRGLKSTKELTQQQENSLFAANGVAPAQEFGEISPGFFLQLGDHFGWVTNYSRILYGKNTGGGWTINSGISFEKKKS